MSKKTKIILAIVAGCFLLGLIGLALGDDETEQKKEAVVEQTTDEEHYAAALKKCSVEEAYDNIRMPEAARASTLKADATFEEWMDYGKKSCEELYKSVYNENVDEFEKVVEETWQDVKDDSFGGKPIAEYLK